MMINSSAKTLIRFAGARRQKLAGWLGTLGLAGIAFGLGTSTSAVNVGVMLLLLGAVLVPDDIIKTITLRDALPAAMLTLFMLLATLWAVHQLRVDADLAWREFRGLVKVAGLPFLAAGWWLLRGHMRYHHLLALLTLGIIIGCFNGIDIERALHTPFAGRKIISDINPNELGFLAGILFTVSSIYLLLNERSTSHLPGSGKLWNLFFIATTGLSGFLVITSQSRAIILGICIAVASVFFVRILVTRFNAGQQRRKYVVIAVSILAIFCLVAFSPMGQVLAKRFDGLGNNLYMLVNADMEPLPELPDSLKFRLMMWQDAVSLIADAPLIGHGPGAAPELLAKSSHTEIRHYKHFHNLWFHLLVVVGAVGTIGFAALFLGFAVSSARDAINTDRHISWSVFGLWIFFFICTLAQLRVHHSSGLAFLTLIGGLSYYCALDTRQKSPMK